MLERLLPSIRSKRNEGVLTPTTSVFDVFDQVDRFLKKVYGAMANWPQAYLLPLLK